ncbi:MAG: 30S ribosomal protein S3ae [Thermoplasmatales archaeon]
MVKGRRDVQLSKEKAGRVAAKKIKDKWKSKVWYTLVTNESFGMKEIGSSPAVSPDDMIGRVSEVALSDITGDYKLSHVKLYFRVTKVEGDKAYTEFEGHEINQDYIRRLIRRRKTRIDVVVDSNTSDGVRLRVKPLIVLDRKVINSIETGIRNKVSEFLKEKISSLPLNQFVVYLFSPQITQDLVDNIKSIYPTRKIEIRKSEVIENTEEGGIPKSKPEESEAGVA